MALTPEEQAVFAAYGGGYTQGNDQNEGLGGDLWTGIKRGTALLPSVATGLADMGVGLAQPLTGVDPFVGKAFDYYGEQLGFQPKKYAEELGAEYSPSTQAHSATLDDILAPIKAERPEGPWYSPGALLNTGEQFVESLKYAGQNPSYGAVLAAESIPAMIAGGVGSAPLRAAGMGAVKSAAIGEGAVMAGQQMDNLQSQGGEGFTNALASLATGGAGTLFALGGGTLARRMGVTDADVLFAGTNTATKLTEAVPKGNLLNRMAQLGIRVGAGGISEGVFEELPQTIAETALENLALGRDVTENMGQNAALGLAAGATMGGAFNMMPRRMAALDIPPPPNPNFDTSESGAEVADPNAFVGPNLPVLGPMPYIPPVVEPQAAPVTEQNAPVDTGTAPVTEQNAPTSAPETVYTQESVPVTNMEYTPGQMKGFNIELEQAPVAATPTFVNLIKALNATDFGDIMNERAEVTGGRPKRSTNTQIEAADNAWTTIAAMIPQLQAEGYDTSGIEKVLSVAAGKPQSTYTTPSIQERGSQPISRRQRTDYRNSKQDGPRGTTWNEIITGMLVGINREFNILAANGPVNAPTRLNVPTQAESESTVVEKQAEPESTVDTDLLTQQEEILDSAQKVEAARQQAIYEAERAKSELAGEEAAQRILAQQQTKKAEDIVVKKKRNIQANAQARTANREEGRKKIQLKAKKKLTLKETMDALVKTVGRPIIRRERGKAALTILEALDSTTPQTSALELLDMVADDLHPEDPLVELADLIISSGAGDIPIRMATPEEIVMMTNGKATETANGVYRFSHRLNGPEIVLNRQILGRGHSVKTLMHEFVHHVTKTALDENMDFRDRAEELLGRVIETLKAQGRYKENIYGLTDVHEFLSEANTNADFQILLVGIPSPDGKTMWQKFIDLIAGYLGLNDAQGTALAEALALTDEIASATINEQDITENAQDWWLGDQAQAEEVNTAFESIISSGVELTKKLFGDDPRTRDLPATGRETVLGFSTLDQIVRRFKDRLKSLTRYDRVMRLKQHIARVHQRAAEEINKVWSTVTDKEKLHKLMESATLAGMHVDRAFYHSSNQHLWKNVKADKLKANKEMHAKLKADFDALTPTARGIYRAVRDFYKDQRDQIRSAGLEYMVDAFKMKGVLSTRDFAAVKAATTLADIEGVDWEVFGESGEMVENSVRDILSESSIKGPYFPLRRFGDYVVDVTKTDTKYFATQAEAYKASRDHKAKDPTNKSKAYKDKDTGQWRVDFIDRQIQFFESEAEANMSLGEFVDKGYGASDPEKQPNGPAVTGKADWNSPGDATNKAILNKVKGRFADNEDVQKALDAAFVELMVESAIRKSELQRKKEKGASLDMQRGFAERAMAGSWALSDMKTAVEHSDVMTELDREAREAPQGEAVKLWEVVKELKKRDAKGIQDRKVHGVDRFLSKFGFVWHLFSPSYGLVNMTQVPLVAAPYLQSKYGVRGITELFSAYNGIFSYTMQELVNKKGGFAGAPDDLLNTIVSAFRASGEKDVANMLEELTDQGIIDATFMQELYETSKGLGNKGVVGNASAFVLDVARAFPQAVEIMNRTVVARAAFNLEMAKTNDKALAMEAAREAVLQTQFDYTDMNKPRYFKAFSGARSIMMFKMYAQGIYALFFGSISKMISGNKQQRREGMKLLFGILGAHSLVAGVSGGLLFEPIRMALWAMSLGADDDDKFDVEYELRNAIAETWGPKAAEVIMEGLPRVAGIDLSGRLGLDNLAWMKSQDTTSFQDAWKNQVIQALGPVAGTIGNMAKGVDYMRKGDPVKAIENWMPKASRDLLKAYRYANDGLTDFGGKTLIKPDDMRAYELFYQGIGFQPGNVAETWASRSKQKSKQQKIQEKSRRLSEQYYDSANQGQFFRENIVPFNTKYPEFAITPKRLSTGLRDRIKQEMDASRGVYSDKYTISKYKKAYNQR